jgi:hypothetical protein
MSVVLPTELEPVLDRFENAWDGPVPPRIEDFMPPGGEPAVRVALLRELVRVDLERRLGRGEDVRLERDYLARFSELAADAEAVAELAAWEFALRRRREPDLSPAEYLARFPQCREALPQRLAVDASTASPGPGLPTPAVAGPGAPGPSRLGSYELLDRLGKGGMGEVYRARHIHLGKPFAVKVLSRRWSGQAELMSRFRREALAAGRLEHPNLVRATDAGEADGTQFLVMELLEGEDLARRTKRLGRWAVADACEAVRQAALGLQHAHEAGLVHRDVKPHNLFLTTDSVVKVLDLGLARLREGAVPAGEETQPGMFLGTPDYAAPEQLLDSRTADARADLYGLGCALFYLLAGMPPFGDARHPTTASKRQAHLTEPPPELRALRADVPEGLAAVVAKLLAKDPQQRYATAAEVAAALAPFAAGGLVAGSDPAAATASTVTYRPLAAAWELPAWIPGLLVAILAIAAGTALARPTPAVAAVLLVALALAGAWWIYCSRRRRLVAGLVGVLEVAGVVALLWPQPGGGPSGGRPLPAPLKGFIDVEMTRPGDEMRRRLRLHDVGALPLKVGDVVFIELKLNRPAFVYVVWIDTKGLAGPVYPWIKGEWQNRPTKEDPVPHLRLPLDGNLYRIMPGPPGLETLMLLARESPLSPLENDELHRRLEGLGPQKWLDPFDVAWFEDGEVVHGEPERGPDLMRPVGAVNPAEQTQEILRRRLTGLFTYTRAVCFGNEGGR